MKKREKSRGEHLVVKRFFPFRSTKSRHTLTPYTYARVSYGKLSRWIETLEVVFPQTFVEKTLLRKIRLSAPPSPVKRIKMEHRKMRACKMRSSFPHFVGATAAYVLMQLEFVRSHHGLLKIPLIFRLSRACEEVRGLSVLDAGSYETRAKRKGSSRAQHLCPSHGFNPQRASQTDNKLIIELLNNSSYLIRGLIKLRAPSPLLPSRLLRERRFETPVNFIRDS